MASGGSTKSLLRSIHSERKDKNAIVESAAENSDDSRSLQDPERNPSPAGSGELYASMIRKRLENQKEVFLKEQERKEMSVSEEEDDEDELEMKINEVRRSKEVLSDPFEIQQTSPDVEESPEGTSFKFEKVESRKESVSPSRLVSPSTQSDRNVYYDLPSTLEEEKEEEEEEEIEFPLEDVATGVASPISIQRAEKLERIAKKKTKIEKKTLMEKKINSAEARVDEFEARLNARQAKIDERHAKLCLRRALFLAKEEKIRETEMRLDDEEILLREKEEQVREREKRIRKEEQGLHIKEGSLVKRDSELTRRLSAVEKRREEIKDRERAFGTINEIIKKQEDHKYRNEKDYLKSSDLSWKREEKYKSDLEDKRRSRKKSESRSEKSGRSSRDSTLNRRKKEEDSKKKIEKESAIMDIWL